MANEKLVPENKVMREALWTLTCDAERYRQLKERFVGADFTQPHPSGKGTRCVLIFDWPEHLAVSKSLDNTVDSLDN